MKIESVSAHFPSRVFTIDDTLERIESHSRDSFEGNLDSALKVIGRLLKMSGAKTRRWLSNGEKPIDLMVGSVEEALSRAGCPKSEVDLLIYTGLGRGFIEPGQSYLLAKAAGMPEVECFDVVDACMSWTRSVSIAHSYLSSGAYKNILIANGEFLNVEGGPLYPENYRLENLKQLQATFPTYTIGNAATATLLSASDGDQDWQWRFGAKTDWADLCTIPAAGFETFTLGESKAGVNGVGRLSSYGDEMHKFAAKELASVLGQLDVDLEEVRCILPHASSKAAWDKFAEQGGVGGKLFHLYPDYGNLVSASVPAGLALATESGAIERGEPVVVWVGSAGMSFGAYSFVY